MMHSEWRP